MGVLGLKSPILGDLGGEALGNDESRDLCVHGGLFLWRIKRGAFQRSIASKLL